MSEDRNEEKLERLAGLMPGKRLVEPPDGVLRRAIALGDALEARPTLGERLCELLFDSGSEPLPVGVRGAAAEERRLLYRLAGEGLLAAELDLRLRREAGGTVELTGQLLPPREGAEVRVRSGRKTCKLQLGEGGEFLARSLPGTAPLELVVDDGFGPPVRVGELPLPDAGTV
jgi:hypothetical protein